MEFTNSQKLSAVLNRFLQPIVVQLANTKMQTLPFIQGIENKVKNMGWVSSNWSVMNELAPIVEPITAKVLEPMLQSYLSKIPDETIPKLAHSVVDEAIKNGGLNLMEGHLQLEMADLEELKKLLNYNLPINEGEEYNIITEAQ